MPKRSLPISEIQQKYYSSIAEEDFLKIVATDTISSNLQKDKLGKYAKWLLNMYKRKGLKLEDLYKAATYIAVFDKAAKMNKLIFIDLNRYKSLPAMYREIKPYMKAKSTTEKLRKIKANEAEKLYEDEAFVVIYPKTKAASRLYGKGTQWCTTGSQFQYYNKKGKLYIIIDKRTGKKYQFHRETESYMDEEDERISMNEDREPSILEKINATNGLFHYLITEFPYLLEDYFGYSHLKILKNNPAWENYCEIYYDGQVYYIVKENSYYALYNAHFEEIIGSPLCAEQIYVTPTNQPVVLKSNYTGICDLNTGVIRWGYKGIVDKEMDWMRREGMRIIY